MRSVPSYPCQRRVPFTSQPLPGAVSPGSRHCVVETPLLRETIRLKSLETAVIWWAPRTSLRTAGAPPTSFPSWDRGRLPGMHSNKDSRKTPSEIFNSGNQNRRHRCSRRSSSTAGPSGFYPRRRPRTRTKSTRATPTPPTHSRNIRRHGAGSCLPAGNTQQLPGTPMIRTEIRGRPAPTTIPLRRARRKLPATSTSAQRMGTSSEVRMWAPVYAMTSTLGRTIFCLV